MWVAQVYAQILEGTFQVEAPLALHIEVDDWGDDELHGAPVRQHEGEQPVDQASRLAALPC